MVEGSDSPEVKESEIVEIGKEEDKKTSFSFLVSN